MQKFKLKGECKELMKKPLKKAAVWAVLTGVVLAKFTEAYQNVFIMYGIAATAQLADEAGVVDEILNESAKYTK